MQEMLRIFAPLTKYGVTSTVWDIVLSRDATLLGCAPGQMRNAVSFLEMLDMTPVQVFYAKLTLSCRLEHITHGYCQNMTPLQAYILGVSFAHVYCEYRLCSKSQPVI